VTHVIESKQEKSSTDGQFRLRGRWIEAGFIYSLEKAGCAFFPSALSLMGEDQQ
jgi:hypothetical protein